MARLFTIISLVLALVLFPPATLAVISNNAVPGDATYPIKRVLEDGIFAVASLNPVTKAWFAAARSDRRFKEFTTLVTQGKKTGDVLSELVEQTQIAANQITQVKDESQKQKLVLKLSESIKKYDQGLQQVSSPSLPQVTPHQQEITLPQTPKPSLSPPSAPTPTPQPIPQPTPTATSAPTPAPVQHPDDEARQRQIEEARRKLEEIKRKLEEQQRRQDEREHRSSSEDRQSIRQENEASFLLRNREESKQEKQKEEKREGKEKKEESEKDKFEKSKDKKESKE